MAAVALALGATAGVLHVRNRRASEAQPRPSSFWRPSTAPALPDAALPSASTVDAGEATPDAPCDADADCPEALSCCGGFCAATAGDRLNCGGCDRVCGGTSACEDSSCSEDCDTAPCPDGTSCMANYCLRSRCGPDAEGDDCALGPETLGQCCSAVCVDVTQSDRHCGACDIACPSGQFCLESACSANVDCADAGGASCALRADRNGECCDDRCVDVQTDRQDCGTCGRSCANGEVCNLGECVAPRCEGTPSDDACLGADGGPNGICCAGRCLPSASYQRDPANCGACQAHCPSGDLCSAGACTEPDSGMAHGCQRAGCRLDEVCMTDGVCLRKGCAGSDDNLPCAESADQDGVCCGQVCTDVTQSQRSCGHCHQACDAGQLCDDGTCKTFAGCGEASGAACPLSGAENGVCCGGGCVDINRDVQHCGSCGQACAAGRSCAHGQCRVADCSHGENGEACDAANAALAECCHGHCVAEVSFDTDAANCGACGLACPRGLPCVDGSCTDPDSGGAWSCEGSGCPEGQACVAGDHCVPTSCSGSEDGLRCAAGDTEVLDTCCAQQCVDTRVNSQSCGGCGKACAAGEFCSLGVCQAFAGCDGGGGTCPLGGERIGLCCASGCDDVETDPHNCGRCDHACPPGVACVAYECQVPLGELDREDQILRSGSH